MGSRRPVGGTLQLTGLGKIITTCTYYRNGSMTTKIINYNPVRTGMIIILKQQNKNTNTDEYVIMDKV
jgi:hypothetical protein